MLCASHSVLLFTLIIFRSLETREAVLHSRQKREEVLSFLENRREEKDVTEK